MISLPMIYVVPLTGPDRNQGRICLVCKAQGMAAIAGFIRPEMGVRKIIGFINQVQALAEQQPSILASVVIQISATMIRRRDGTYEEALRPEFKAYWSEYAARASVKVLLAALPSGGLPDSVPVHPQSTNTILFYRNRQLTERFHNIDTPEGILPAGLIEQHALASGESRAEERQLEEIIRLDEANQSMITPAIGKLEAAVARLHSRSL